MTSQAEKLAGLMDYHAAKEIKPAASSFGQAAAELRLLAAEVESLRADAERYRALKARHAFLIVRRLLGHSGYSTVTADRYIDQYADNAIADVKAHDESKENPHG